jgi:hypothetical protein
VQDLLDAGYVSTTIWEWQWNNSKEEVFQICEGFLGVN